MKIVINRCHGGFGLSEKAIELLFEKKGWTLVRKVLDSTFTSYYKDSIQDDNFFNEFDLDRNDPDLVAVVEEIGDKANGWAAVLKVVDVPEDVIWYIEEYDGIEWVAENYACGAMPLSIALSIKKYFGVEE